MGHKANRNKSSLIELYPQLAEQPSFSLKDVARIFSIGIPSAHYWRLSGKLRGVTRTGGREGYRVPRNEIIRLLEEKKIEIPGLWTHPKSVLVIDDDARIREGIRKELAERRVPLELALAADVEEGLRIAKKMRPDVIVLDYFFPAGRKQGDHALAFIAKAKELVKAKVIGISVDAKVGPKMLEAGAVSFFAKPVRLEIIKDEIFRQATSDRRRDREKRRPLKLVIQDSVRS